MDSAVINRIEIVQNFYFLLSYTFLSTDDQSSLLWKATVTDVRDVRPRREKGVKIKREKAFRLVSFNDLLESLDYLPSRQPISDKKTILFLFALLFIALRRKSFLFRYPFKSTLWIWYILHKWGTRKLCERTTGEKFQIKFVVCVCAYIYICLIYSCRDSYSFPSSLPALPCPCPSPSSYMRHEYTYPYIYIYTNIDTHICIYTHTM